jgi:hypothetical protein
MKLLLAHFWNKNFEQIFEHESLSIIFGDADTRRPTGEEKKSIKGLASILQWARANQNKYSIDRSRVRDKIILGLDGLLARRH